MKPTNRIFATGTAAQLLLAALLILYLPSISFAQTDRQMEAAQKAIKEAQEKADDAKYAVEDAEKAVKKRKEELDKLPKSNDPKEHGPMDPELSRLMDERNKAQSALEKANADLELANAEKAVLDAEKDLKDEKAKRPKDAGKVKDAENKLKRAKKLRDALKKWVDALKKGQGVGDAKKALDKAKAENAVEEAKEGVEREKARRPRDPKALEDAEKKLEEAEENLRNIVLVPDNGGLNSGQRNHYIAAISGSYPLGGLENQNVAMTALQEAVFSPGTAEQIFERLDGADFFIGDFSSEHSQTYPLQGNSSLMPGLRLGMGLGNRFELRAGAQHFRSTWSGRFPVTVFPSQSTQPQTMQGSMSASASGVLAETDLAFFLSSGRVRPYVRGGVQGIFPMENNSSAELAGVSIPLEVNPVATSFAPFGGGGVRIGFLRNGFVDLGAIFGKVPGGSYAPSVGLWIGWRFGGGNTSAQNGDKPDIVFQEKDKDCGCELISLTYHGQTGDGLEAPEPDKVGAVEKDLMPEIGKEAKIPWKGQCKDKYVVKAVVACTNATCIDIKWDKGVGDKGKELGQIKRTSKGNETYYGTSETGTDEPALKKKGYKPVEPTKAFGHASKFKDCSAVFMFAICAHTPDNPLSATLVYKCNNEKTPREKKLFDLTLDTTWETAKEEKYQKYATQRAAGKSHEDLKGEDDFKTRYDSEVEKKKAAEKK